MLEHGAPDAHNTHARQIGRSRVDVDSRVEFKELNRAISSRLYPRCSPSSAESGSILGSTTHQLETKCASHVGVLGNAVDCGISVSKTVVPTAWQPTRGNYTLRKMFEGRTGSLFRTPIGSCPTYLVPLLLGLCSRSRQSSMEKPTFSFTSHHSFNSSDLSL